MATFKDFQPPGSDGAQAHISHGPDSVFFTMDTPKKSERDPIAGTEPGYVTKHASVTVAGPGDWTAANSESYAGQAGLFLPSLIGNMPVPGDGRKGFQTAVNHGE